VKQLTIISGKGGTGKTAVAASFAALAENKVLADCDVDASNLHLLLQPQIEREEPFYGMEVAVLDEQRCVECDACREVCRYRAIRQGPVIMEMRCTGCGVCTLVCPEEAISLERRVNGALYRSRTPYGPLAHARLLPGAEGSGRLVTAVRLLAENLAAEWGADFILIDGPPGIGCMVTASLTGVDLALIVTEPTLSGRHDLERVLGVACHFGVETLVCINKYDLNAQNAAAIRDYCTSLGIPVSGEIPFDRRVTEAHVAGYPVVHYDSSPAAQAMENLWEQVAERLKEAS